MAEDLKKQDIEKKNQEKELLEKLTAIVSEYTDYEVPRMRSDGDIVISLDSDLKKNRQAFQSLADAVQLIMNSDKPKSKRRF